MKQIFIFSITIVLSVNCFSQFKKNDLKVAFAVSPLYGSSEQGSGFNGISFKPSLGYFISNNLSIDLNFSYATQREISINNVDSYYNSYSFIPTMRYHYLNQKKLRLFAEAGYGLGGINYEAENGNLNNTRHEELSGGISVLNLGIGGNYFFNDKFGIELLVPYLAVNNFTSENVRTLYEGIAPTFGLTFKI